MSVKYGHIPTDSRLFKKINSMDALQAILWAYFKMTLSQLKIF